MTLDDETVGYDIEFSSAHDFLIESIESFALGGSNENGGMEIGKASGGPS